MLARIVCTGSKCVTAAGCMRRETHTMRCAFGLCFPSVDSRGGGRGGAKGGAKVVIEPHRHEGVFIARGSKEDTLVTLNSTPGKDVYGEKRIAADGPPGPDGVPTKLEYRVWNPFRSKLAAAILGGELHAHNFVFMPAAALS